MLMKRRYNYIIHRYIKKIFKLNMEIKTYRPSNKMVLSKGSLAYQYDVERYPIIKPLPEFLNTSHMIVRFVPPNIYPPTTLFNLHTIYGYYIEKHNLYMVSDIEIHHTTALERRNLLQSNHSIDMEITQFITNHTDKTIWYYV